MKVSQFIERLKKFPQDYEITRCTDDYGYHKPSSMDVMFLHEDGNLVVIGHSFEECYICKESLADVDDIVHYAGLLDRLKHLKCHEDDIQLVGILDVAYNHCWKVAQVGKNSRNNKWYVRGSDGIYKDSRNTGWDLSDTDWLDESVKDAMDEYLEIKNV